MNAAGRPLVTVLITALDIARAEQIAGGIRLFPGTPIAIGISDVMDVERAEGG